MGSGFPNANPSRRESGAQPLAELPLHAGQLSRHRLKSAIWGVRRPDVALCVAVPFCLTERAPRPWTWPGDPAHWLDTVCQATISSGLICHVWRVDDHIQHM